MSDLVDQKAGLFGSRTLIQSGFFSRCNSGFIVIFGPQLLICRQTKVARHCMKAENPEQFQFSSIPARFSIPASEFSSSGNFRFGRRRSDGGPGRSGTASK